MDETLGKGRYILVTGGAGYIGSHAVKLLNEAGYKPIILDNLSTGSLRNVLGPLIVGDIGDKFVLEKIFSEYQINAVMHFAANSIVEESMMHPGKYFENNVAKGIPLLNVMIKYGVKKFVFSSSCVVYGDPKYLPVDENHPLAPVNPYGESKLMFEKILQWYHKAHGLGVVIFRYFNAAGASLDNIIGERRTIETHLVPRVLKVAAKQWDCLEVYGNDYETADGTAVRDYVHVEDIANAHMLALNKLDKELTHSIYNIGTGKGYSVAQVVETSVEITARMIPIEQKPRRAGDPAALVANFSKAKEELGFEPKCSDLPNIISTAWAWHNKLHQEQD